MHIQNAVSVVQNQGLNPKHLDHIDETHKIFIVNNETNNETYTHNRIHSRIRISYVKFVCIFFCGALPLNSNIYASRLKMIASYFTICVGLNYLISAHNLIIHDWTNDFFF